MAIPEHNNNLNNTPENNTYEDHEAIDQWLCSQCFKTISSSRPPVFIPENCSCVEVTGGGSSPSPRDFEQPMYHYDNTATPDPLYHNRAQSYASSALSFNGPESPERDNVDLRVGNSYLPLGPEDGLNETQHRRSASFESDLSFQMRRFLVEDSIHHYEEDADIYGGTERGRGGRGGNWLEQGVVMGYGNTSSKKVHKGSKPSWVSGDSGEVEEISWGNRGEVMGHVGAWMDDYGGVAMEREKGWVYEGELVMSGVMEGN